MRTRPTPSPWHYETTPQGHVTIYATRNGEDDKIIIGMSQFGSIEQREANARLIAAAPELYEALERCAMKLRRCASNAGNADFAVDALCEPFEIALAKARGETVSA